MTVNITAFEGRLAFDPQLHHSPAGHPVCEAVVLINRRTKDSAGKWHDAEPTRRYIRARRTRAVQLAALKTGTTVVVIGTIQTEAWTDKESDAQPGDRRTRDIVTVESIGHGLLLDRADETEHINLTRTRPSPSGPAEDSHDSE